jgi:hypothetical protein
MYKTIFCEPTKCMPKKTIQAISEVGDKYITNRGTNIKIIGATKMPPLLPQFIPNKLALQEVKY